MAAAGASWLAPASSLSLEVERTSRGIVVSLHGPCDGGDVALVERVLEDLVRGQGNRAVTVQAHSLGAGEPKVDQVLLRVAALARARGAHFARDDR